MATYRVNEQGKKRRVVVSFLLLAVVGMGAITGVLFAPSCDTMSKPGSSDKFERVTLSGKPFNLEVADTPELRYQGLSNRTRVDPDGGMLFVFPTREVQQLGFVMRDCPNPIDIIFVDGNARVTAFHRMLPEEPRRAGETDVAYNARLKKYPSKFPAQFVIELAGNALDNLNIKEGDKIALDVDRLKRRAK